MILFLFICIDPLHPSSLKILCTNRNICKSATNQCKKKIARTVRMVITFLHYNLYHILKTSPLSRKYRLFSKHSTFMSPMTKQGAPLYVRYQWLIALIANYFNAR